MFVTPQGQLYVADDARDTQQIRVFDTTKTPVQEVSGKVLGDKGGVVAAGGAYGPAKFDGLKGVGVDNAGNYYVASDGLGSSQFASPITLDAQAPGTEWSPQKTTLTTDRYTCPTDGRVMGADGYNTAVAVRYMGPDHRKVMFTTGQGNVGRLSMFRFTADGHAQPAAIFTENIDNQVWPPNEPTKWGTGDHVWSWRDTTGDCQFGDDEFAAPMDLSVRSNWSVSEKDNLPNHRAGDVWLAGYKQSVGPVLKRVRFTGTFENGSPVYDTANVEVMPLPQPFVDAYGVVSQSATDTLYLLGVNVNDPTMRKGWQLARYDKFYEKYLAKASQAAAWLRQLPDDVAFCDTDPHKECRINSLTAEGDRVYVGNIAAPTDDLTGRIRMFDAATGTPVGQLVPGPEVAHTSGWHDMKQAVAATQLPDGRRFVLAEENFASRILLHHGF